MRECQTIGNATLRAPWWSRQTPIRTPPDLLTSQWSEGSWRVAKGQKHWLIGSPVLREDTGFETTAETGQS